MRLVPIEQMRGHMAVGPCVLCGLPLDSIVVGDLPTGYKPRRGQAFVGLRRWGRKRLAHRGCYETFIFSRYGYRNDWYERMPAVRRGKEAR